MELGIQNKKYQRQFHLQPRSFSSPALHSLESKPRFSLSNLSEDKNSTSLKTLNNNDNSNLNKEQHQKSQLFFHRVLAFITSILLFIPFSIYNFLIRIAILFHLTSNTTNKQTETLEMTKLASDSSTTTIVYDGPSPTSSQQTFKRSLASFLGWIPFFSTTIPSSPAFASPTAVAKTQQGDASSNNDTDSNSIPSTPKQKTKSRSKPSTPGTLEKPKTRSRKSSSSTGNRPRSIKSDSGTGTNTPTNSELDLPTRHDQETYNSTPKRRKSPLSYAFKVPRIYSPPRPLLPPQTFKPLSLWQLLSLSLSGPKPSEKQEELSKGRPTATSLASSSVPLQMSSNANAIHYRRLKKKTLILDLDETLIHTLSRTPGFSQGAMVEVKLNSYATLYTVLKRPFCDEFLQTVSQWYNLVVFTASVQAYADPMIDWLEKDRKYFVQRYYRQHCTQTNMGYVKDLGAVDPDLSNVMIIDNSPISYLQHKANGIGIEGWINDPSDNSLLALIPFLAAIRFSTDVRSILGLKAGDAAFT